MSRRLYGYFAAILVHPDELLAFEYDDRPAGFESRLAGIAADPLQCVAELAIAKLGLVAILNLLGRHGDISQQSAKYQIVMQMAMLSVNAPATVSIHRSSSRSK
jgi:hypothetical protein